MPGVNPRPMISVAVLERMARTLSPDELASLPLRKLPDIIDETVLELASPANRAILKGFQKQLSHRRANRNNDAANGALVTEPGQRVPAGLRILERDISDLAGLIHRWRNDVYQAVEVRSVEFHQSFEQSEFNQITATTGHTEDELVRRKCEEINRLLSGLQADFAGLFQTEWVLQATISEGGAGAAEASAVLSRLRLTISPLENLMARYRALRLSIAQHEMGDALANLSNWEYDRQQLQSEIAALEHRLRKAKSWVQPLNRNSLDAENQYLEGQLVSLKSQLRHPEGKPSERELTRWLDAVVEVRLDPIACGMASTGLQKSSNLLCRLLAQCIPDVVLDLATGAGSAGKDTLLDRYFHGKAGDSLSSPRGASPHQAELLQQIKTDILRQLPALQF